MRLVAAAVVYMQTLALTYAYTHMMQAKAISAFMGQQAAGDLVPPFA